MRGPARLTTRPTPPESATSDAAFTPRQEIRSQPVAKRFSMLPTMPDSEPQQILCGYGEGVRRARQSRPDHFTAPKRSLIHLRAGRLTSWPRRPILDASATNLPGVIRARAVDGKSTRTAQRISSQVESFSKVAGEP